MTNSQKPDALSAAQDAELKDVLDSTQATEEHLNDQSGAGDAQASTETAPAAESSASAKQPATPKPTAVIPTAAKPQTAAAPVHTTDLDEAAKFAEVSDNGHVTLIDGEERVEVGQVPEASDEDALAYFVRKYDDAFTQLLLLEQRFSTNTSSPELKKTLDQVDKLIQARQMVGDMDALRKKSAALATTLERRRAAEKLAREQAAADQQAQREKIVEEAESLAAQDPEKTRWKSSSQKMKDLFDQWRTVQKAGPRLPREVEDALWARFRSARSSFDKARRAFFSQLDERNAEAKKVKEKLITRAEELSDSTTWGPTSTKYRQLMDEWKAAPRASRKEDDALWNRFNAAREKFFSARKAANQQQDQEFEANLKVKEEVLAEANKHLPFKDVETARSLMRDFRARWDDAGMVPRNAKNRMDAGFRKLEDALQKAEDDHWARTNPETKARTNSAVSQLEETIAGLEEELAQAQAKGDDKKIKQAEEALEARRSWLEVVKASAN